MTDVNEKVRAIKVRTLRALFNTTAGPSLFKQQNFVFATTSPNRSPSFYFEYKYDQNGVKPAELSGRLRTQHDDGPRIEIFHQIKRHLFTSKKENLKVLDRELIYDSRLEDLQYLENIRQGRHLEDSIFENNKFFNGAPAFRTQPRAGDYHCEYVPMAFKKNKLSYHPSDGVVQLMPRPTDVKIAKIIDGILLGGGALVQYMPEEKVLIKAQQAVYSKVAAAPADMTRYVNQL